MRNLLLLSFLSVLFIHCNNKPTNIVNMTDDSPISKCKDDTNIVDTVGFNWSKPINGLQLGIKAQGALITLELKNISDKTIIAYSHVETHEIQYDWFSFRVFLKDGFRLTVNNGILIESPISYFPVNLSDFREISAPVYKSLGPGESISHTINLFNWIGRNVNNNLKLEGNYEIQAIYKNEPCTDCSEFYKSFWTGIIETPAIPFFIKNLDKIKVKVKITNFLPVAWGDIHKAVIEEVIEGNKQDFSDTIEFGITASREFEFLKTGDVRIITFQNTGKINEQPILPPINGMVSKLNEMWDILKIEK